MQPYNVRFSNCFAKTPEDRWRDGPSRERLYDDYSECTVAFFARLARLEIRNLNISRPRGEAPPSTNN